MCCRRGHQGRVTTSQPGPWAVLQSGEAAGRHRPGPQVGAAPRQSLLLPTGPPARTICGGAGRLGLLPRAPPEEQRLLLPPCHAPHLCSRARWALRASSRLPALCRIQTCWCEGPCTTSPFPQRTAQGLPSLTGTQAEPACRESARTPAALGQNSRVRAGTGGRPWKDGGHSHPHRLGKSACPEQSPHHLWLHSKNKKHISSCNQPTEKICGKSVSAIASDSTPRFAGTSPTRDRARATTVRAGSLNHQGLLL